ncbi:hypothetical protein BDN71DRAFT_1473528 [Pleurotus eryngii]|uniref:PWWP domain-containing protein n=1 Tax=Pleurotus eryngii TaxID=5323 RepID=A0A9P5ZSL2_PLEER|nr:hypothetical protein BDN71DRAFT_1473528 [Pleurotus eryngii]
MSTAKKGSQKQPKQPAPPATSYDVRDIVLGKVRGFPSWPGMIVDPTGVPPAVLKERPHGKKTKSHCVRFFPRGDYAWLASKDISKLQVHEIQSYLNAPHKKNGELLEGFKIALDPKEWEENIEERIAALDEAEANADVDQLDDSDGEGVGGGQKKSKKRKRESDAAGASKTKTLKKPRASAAKKGSEEPGSIKATARKTPAKGRKSGTKSKTMVESEDDGEGREEDEEGDSGPSNPVTSPPPAKKTKRNEKEEEDLEADLAKDPEAVKVREWRHKLQKTFLSPKAMPKEEEMPAIDSLFTTIETYNRMTIQYLQFSKIGKVMRHIAALDEGKVPRDAEFKFRDRAKDLVETWHHILNRTTTNGSGNTNGTSINGLSAAITGAGDANGHGAETAQSDTAAMTSVVTDKTAAMDLDGKVEATEPTTTMAAYSGDVAMAD